MTRYEVLKGLPPYGEPVISIRPTGRKELISEHYVVRFTPEEGEPWVGNFEAGINSFCGVWPHPNGRELVVISGGQAYVIAPESPNNNWTCLGPDIIWAREPETMEGLLLVSELDVEFLGPEGTIWKTWRLSWDGIRNLVLEDLTLKGEGWNLSEWRPFEIDLLRGGITGGAYP